MTATGKLSLTQDQLQAMLTRNPHLRVNGQPSKPAQPKEQPKRAPSHTPGKMNKTETRFADILAMRKRRGEIADYGFEAYKLVLAYRMTYTPDFHVITNDGQLEFHEVKGGFIREDAWLKLKMAAQKFQQHKFILDQWKDGNWIIKEIKTLGSPGINHTKSWNPSDRSTGTPTRRQRNSLSLPANEANLKTPTEA